MQKIQPRKKNRLYIRTDYVPMVLPILAAIVVGFLGINLVMGNFQQSFTYELFTSFK